MTDKNSLIFSEAGPLNPLTDDIDDSTEARALHNERNASFYTHITTKRTGME